jgi:heme oxygenase (biliverdin-IX-beta and delta-forming)
MPLTISVTIAQRLRSETLQAHEKAEKILAPKLASINSYRDYASILKMFYGFFSPLEKSISKYVSSDLLEDIHERRSSLFILPDLKAIGYSTEQFSVCKYIPLINSVPQALGAMYVLEGSTLGGRMISKILMKNIHVRFDYSNLNFFSGYGDATGEKWKTFLSTIDQYSDDANEIVDSANETFDCLTKWMEESL